MKGDIIIVEEHHRAAAHEIVDAIMERISDSPRPVTICVSGESGSGKSETGTAIAEELENRGLHAFLFHQDDYFILPPKSNDAKRRKDISWVGPQEVRLDLLDSHLSQGRARAAIITKPLIDYETDSVEEEAVPITGVQVFIAEGTYTSLLNELDLRVFINRNRLETMESRRRRGREKIEPFIEEVLEIEHRIIAPHKDRADIVLDRDYKVEFRP